MRAILRLPPLLCCALALAGCKSGEPAPVKGGSVPATPSAASAKPELDRAPPQASNAPPHPVDELFRRYRDKLPSPATLSEGNGTSLKCPHHGHATYTLLAATARRLPIEGDKDLPPLIPWIRDGDPCIRQIALKAILPKIGFESRKFSVPSMHDPEHVQYHEILASLKSYLDQKRVSYDSTAFAGSMLSVAELGFPTGLNGAWKEEVAPSRNFQHIVELDAETIRVTHKYRGDDPNWADQTLTTKIKDVRLNDRLQYVVSGVYSIASSSKGHQGPKVEPARYTYVFWPVAKNIVWFDNGAPGDWKKLTR